jgi:hypothetical protein
VWPPFITSSTAPATSLFLSSVGFGLCQSNRKQFADRDGAHGGFQGRRLPPRRGWTDGDSAERLLVYHSLAVPEHPPEPGFRDRWPQIRHTEHVTDCSICRENETSENGTDPWLVARLQTGYVRLSPNQYFKGSLFFVAKQCVREVFDLEISVRDLHLAEMAEVAAAVNEVFTPLKMNIESLGNGVPPPALVDHPQVSDRSASKGTDMGGPRLSEDALGRRWSTHVRGVCNESELVSRCPPIQRLGS